MPTTAPTELREMLRAALAAYEQARAVRLDERRRADQVLEQSRQAQEAAERKRRTALEAQQRIEAGLAGGEQERLEQLLAETAALEQAARKLLEQAGLAHIAGAPAAVDGTPPPARRGDAKVTQAFVAAHTAYVDLRSRLYQLAEAQFRLGRWEEVRRTLQPLLAAKDTPLYPAAAALERATYLTPAQAALDACEWEAARKYIEPWLQGHKDDQEAVALDRARYVLSAKQAIKQKEWMAARKIAAELVKRDKDDIKAKALNQEVDSAQLADLVAQGKWLDFVTIPAGTFQYGENKQQVAMDEFAMSRTPITNAQYEVFVQTTGHESPKHWSNGNIPAGKENHPVVNVSWEDAQQFCRWAGVRLPSQWQWEKAARGADGRLYPWGDKPPDLDLCNFNNQVGDTTPVGSYPEGASPYGLLDMAGNVWEWCEDTYDTIYRELRGGAFDRDIYHVRCARRFQHYDDSKYLNIGYRVVALDLRTLKSRTFG